MRDDETRSRPFAKAMRAQMTDAETILWSRLRGRQVEGAAFRRQHPIGPFIADFACWEASLVIEVDGATHGEEREAYDAARTAELEMRGWTVLRFGNGDVYDTLNGVLEAIRLRVLEARQVRQNRR
jgi:very-short-patch-repair endonuclease